ncbi:MAG: hypothetical protein EON54_22655 [Alcaligenaceae bacterium]|nr:MAG: hypothetical protein EON54_22655 [Alcaligenaceae bacterium]
MSQPDSQNRQRLFVTFDLPPEVRAILETAFTVTYARPGFKLAPGVSLDCLEKNDLLLVSATGLMWFWICMYFFLESLDFVLVSGFAL